MSATESLACAECLRGQEACEYCHDAPTIDDWLAICDCGLASHGYHLTSCLEREGHRWVIACSYPSAEERR